MSSPKFSGSFKPTDVESQKGKTEFQVPLNSYKAKDQVVGEKDSNRLYMPGRLRKYIPTLYKQVWLNSRAILSVNGYELVNNQATGEKLDNGNDVLATTVTSDLRTSVLRSDGGDFQAMTNPLKTDGSETGMTKVVISGGPNKDNTARSLKAHESCRFMVHDGELYDTYVFTEIGGHITYVQGNWIDKPADYQGSVETIYMVLDYEGFFLNSAEANTFQVADLNQPGIADAPDASATPAADPAADSSA